MTHRRTVAAASAVALAATLTLALTGTPAASAAPAGSAADRRPGDVLTQRPSTSPMNSGADVQRLRYVSTGAKGERTTIGGTLFTPTAAWAGPGERPLVTYAVGTQGMGDQCAPSRQFAAGTEYESSFVQGLLTRGYAVVVTDYQGLGTAGTHAYVNSVALGHNVLDAARAAQRVRTDAVPASAPVLVAGYSEGGNAAAAALQQHASYAPDVDVVAGYAGAVPADLTAVAPNIDGSPYAAFLVYSVKALDAIYPELHIRRLLNAEGRRALAQGNKTCTSDGLAPFAFKHSSDYTKSGQPVTAFLARPDIAAVLDQLKLGRVAPDVPVLVAHSVADDVVPFAQDRAMVQSWCDEGADVTFAPGAAPTHVAGAVEGFPKALAFFEQVVEGQHPAGTCGTL